jgi:hypothetical protein
MVAHTHSPSYLGGQDKNNSVKAGTGKVITRLYLRNKLKAKQTGVMAQVVEHLPNKCKTLNSSPSTRKKKGARRFKLATVVL